MRFRLLTPFRSLTSRLLFVLISELNFVLTRSHSTHFALFVALFANDYRICIQFSTSSKTPHSFAQSGIKKQLRPFHLSNSIWTPLQTHFNYLNDFPTIKVTARSRHLFPRRRFRIDHDWSPFKCLFNHCPFGSFTFFSPVSGSF
jgi:hypothetical protein